MRCLYFFLLWRCEGGEEAARGRSHRYAHWGDLVEGRRNQVLLCRRQKSPNFLGPFQAIIPPHSFAFRCGSHTQTRQKHIYSVMFAGIKRTRHSSMWSKNLTSSSPRTEQSFTQKSWVHTHTSSIMYVYIHTCTCYTYTCMCTYMCVCVCITCVCTHMCMCTHVCITYIHIHIHTYTCTHYVYVYVYTHTHVYTCYTYIHIHTHIHTHVCIMCMCTHIHTHAYMYTLHIHVHMHTHTHIHVYRDCQDEVIP
jgi:hypothetical protein